MEQKIVDFLVPHNVARIAVFGSYARGEERPDSDLDLMVTFRERTSLLKQVALEQELSEILGVKVDLLTEKSISPHLIGRISAELKVIYQ